MPLPPLASLAIIGDKPLQLPAEVTHTFRSGRVETYTGNMRPDELFGIRTGEVITYYLLECENTSPVEPELGGLSRSSFLRKLLCYHDCLVVKKLHKELLGLRAVKLLVTAPTKDMLEYKMKVAGAVLGPARDIYYQVVPKNGKLANLFTTPWLRVGYPPISIDTGEEVVQLDGEG